MNKILFLGILLFCLGLFSVHESMGQIVPEMKKYKRSTPELWGRISDTTRLGAVPLAHVFLLHGKDTVKLVSNLTGRFIYNGRLADTMQIQVTALGFKPFSGLYIPKKHGLDICIQMQQDEIALDEVIISGKFVMMVVKGDTLQYNTNEIKTLEGAKLGSVLEKLPGVSLEEDLKVNGIPIQRIYINGDSLFEGTKALNYITADNVKDVKVFDEQNKDDLAQGMRYGRREKVMDVTTKREVTLEEITQTITHEQKRNTFIIGGGVDASRNRTSKYPEKFLLKYTYEKGMQNTVATSDAIRFSANYSNLSPQDRREFGGEFKYDKKYTHLSYNSRYTYRNATTYFNRWNEQNYFPSEQYNSRYYSQNSSEKNTDYEYFTVQEIGFQMKKINFNISGTYSYHVNKSLKNSWILSQLDEKIINSADIQDYNKKNNSEGTTTFKIFSDPKKATTFELSSEFKFALGGQQGWQIDTLKTSNQRIYLNRDWDDDQFSWRTTLDFSTKVSPVFKLFVRSTCDYSESSSKGLGKNQLTGSLDTTDTRNYTWYTNTYWLKGTLTYYGNRMRISGGGKITHNSRNIIERFPSRKQTKNYFLYFNPRLNLQATLSPMLNLTANYYTATRISSPNECRNVINDANPLSLSAGNPNLKSTQEHTINITCNKMLPFLASAFETFFSFQIKHNPIVSNSRYFTETTYLKEYNYTVKQGATLYTYENSDPEYAWEAKIGFEKFWSFLGKCKFRPGYTRNTKPSFTQGERNDLSTESGEFEMNIRTNFSKKVKLDIFSTTTFSRSNSQLGQANESIREEACLIGSTQIFPKFLVETDIRYLYQKDLTIQHKDNNIMLNVTITRELGKYLLISLNGYNLLDSKNNNEIGRTAEYDFRRGGNQTGRYVTLNISCKF